jgi:pre-mRNA-splicing factor ATP-dependent RNA helicase DHX15/PRP43
MVASSRKKSGSLQTKHRTRTIIRRKKSTASKRISKISRSAASSRRISSKKSQRDSIKKIDIEGFQILATGIMDPEGKYPNPFTGRPATEYYKTMALHIDKPWSAYQPWKDAHKLLKMIHDHQIVLVIASTGVGKTVIFPKLLAHYFNYEKPVICTVPRQKITEENAEFAAKLMDVPLFEIDPVTGKDILDASGKKQKTGMYYVGYRHGDAKTMSDKTTKLLFATDSLIKQFIQRDYLLSEYGGIIIDEAHERSIHIDILIKLVFDIVRERPDFRVIIMSATVNKDTFMKYIKVQGLEPKFALYESIAPTQYKIHIKRQSQPIKAPMVISTMYNTIKKILLDKDSRRGDILAFVTSEGETVKLAKMINNDYKEFRSDCKPFGVPISRKAEPLDKTIAIEKNGLELAEKETGRPYHVKVIIATNIAESSLTFKNPVVYVVESGMAYENIWDPSNYVFNAGKNYITQANIIQRCGRTGRTAEGECIQMYSQLQYEKFAKYPAPSILKEDITGELLSILNLPQVGGVLSRALVFLHNMIEPVLNYRDRLIVAIRNLIDMDLMVQPNKNPKVLGVLTPVASTVLRFGKYDIRNARMVLAASLMDIPEPAMMLAAILTTITKPDDIFFKRKDASKQYEMLLQKIQKRWMHPSGDHLTLLNVFIHWMNSESRSKMEKENLLNRRTLKRIEMAYADIARLVKTINLERVSMPGIQRAKRKTIRLSQITNKAIDESDKEQIKPEDPTLPEADDAVEGIQEEQFGGEDESSKQVQPQEINFAKYFPKEILDKLLLALAYGFNTNLGYYNPKFGNYQIMNSKYMVDMKESVLATSKRPPKYVIYYQAIHLADKNETNFQIVSEITEPILVQLVQQKKERSARNAKMDWDAIKKAVDNIKAE